MTESEKSQKIEKFWKLLSSCVAKEEEFPLLHTCHRSMSDKPDFDYDYPQILMIGGEHDNFYNFPVEVDKILEAFGDIL